jgi:hypothetical protein
VCLFDRLRHFFGKMGKEKDPRVCCNQQTTEWVKDRPQAIIHLDFKKVDFDAVFDKVKLPITPSNFIVKAEDLFDVLIAKYNEYLKRYKEKKTDLSTAVSCIINQTGLSEIIEYDSKSEITKALTRLFINGDDEAIKTFLKIVANSICQEMMASTEKTKDPETT